MQGRALKEIKIDHWYPISKQEYDFKNVGNNISSNVCSNHMIYIGFKIWYKVLLFKFGI